MFTIGRLAHEAGVKVDTIRYYERRGLLEEPPRTPSGYRQYSEDALWRLTFIARAKSLGFTLAEIEQLLVVGATPAAVRSATEAKLKTVVERQRELEELRGRLEALARSCSSGDDDCVTLTVTSSGRAPRADGGGRVPRSGASRADRR